LEAASVGGLASRATRVQTCIVRVRFIRLIAAVTKAVIAIILRITGHA
jgi:hypothetical protein